MVFNCDKRLMKKRITSFLLAGLPKLLFQDSFAMHKDYQEGLQQLMAKVIKDPFSQQIGIKL